MRQTRLAQVEGGLYGVSRRRFHPPVKVSLTPEQLVLDGHPLAVAVVVPGGDRGRHQILQEAYEQLLAAAAVPGVAVLNWDDVRGDV
jgi:hypothetical protein